MSSIVSWECKLICEISSLSLKKKTPNSINRLSSLRKTGFPIDQDLAQESPLLLRARNKSNRAPSTIVGHNTAIMEYGLRPEAIDEATQLNVRQAEVEALEKACKKKKHNTAARARSKPLTFRQVEDAAFNPGDLAEQALGPDGVFEIDGGEIRDRENCVQAGYINRKVLGRPRKLQLRSMEEVIGAGSVRPEPESDVFFSSDMVSQGIEAAPNQEGSKKHDQPPGSRNMEHLLSDLLRNRLRAALPVPTILGTKRNDLVAIQIDTSDVDKRRRLMQARIDSKYQKPQRCTGSQERRDTSQSLSVQDRGTLLARSRSIIPAAGASQSQPALHTPARLFLPSMAPMVLVGNALAQPTATQARSSSGYPLYLGADHAVPPSNHNNESQGSQQVQSGAPVVSPPADPMLLATRRPGLPDKRILHRQPSIVKPKRTLLPASRSTAGSGSFRISVNNSNQTRLRQPVFTVQGSIAVLDRRQPTNLRGLSISGKVFRLLLGSCRP